MAKDNIRVVCRFRPLNKAELANSEAIKFKILDNKTVELKEEKKNTRDIDHKYNFDYIFDMDTEQKHVFNIVAKPVIEGVFDGWNGSILTYGQTSSGKTFTMQGSMVKKKLKGIVPRLVSSLFQFIYDSPEHLEFIVKISMLEIYLEEIKDLLNPNSQKKVRIRNSPTTGITLQNLGEVCVGDELEVENVMSRGLGTRTVGRTNMNEVSSRSHLITLIQVTQTDTIENNIKKGKLYLVDLAGSEKVGKTGAKGQRLEEAKLINKSLFTLGTVINSLTSNAPFIPYRNSKLTQILQETLGGNSKTTLIVTCSPAIYNIEETISTLKFGVNAKKIKNKAKVNEEISKKQLLKDLKSCKKKLDYQIGYTDFLKYHIKHKLNAPIPKYKKGEKEKKAIIKEERRKSIITGALPIEMINEFKEKISSLEKTNAASISEIESLKKQLEESKNQNNKITKKFQGLFDDYKNSQRKNLELNEELLHVEETNKELMVTLDNFENMNLQKENNIDHLMGVSITDMDNEKTIDEIVQNLQSSDKEKELISNCFEKYRNKNKKNENQNLKMNNIINNLLKNYKNIVEVELPSLEGNHKEIVENIEKNTNIKNLFCNNKLINAINKYIEQIANNEKMIKRKDKKIYDQHLELKNYKKKTKRTLNALKNKIELLSKCVNICVSKIEDQNSKNVNHGHLNVDINFKDLDNYYSNNFQTLGKQNLNDGNKVIKMIRGRVKVPHKEKSDSSDEEENQEIEDLEV